jgi:deoxycytidylate deaminase
MGCKDESNFLESVFYGATSVRDKRIIAGGYNGSIVGGRVLRY